MAVSIAGSHPEDLPEILHGLIESALLHQSKSAVKSGAVLSVIRINLNCLA